MKPKKGQDSGALTPDHVPADDMATGENNVISKLREDNERLQHQAETQKGEIETLKDQMRDLAAGQGKKLNTPRKPIPNVSITVDNAPQRVIQTGLSPDVQARLLKKLQG